MQRVFRQLIHRLKNKFQSQSVNEWLIMSTHGNGYKREDAVRQLGQLKNPIAIPYLLIRANDWVPEIRQTALHSLRTLLIPQNAKAWVSSLGALQHLQSCGRTNHAPLIQEVWAFLCRPENRQALLNGLTDPNPKIARSVFEQVEKHQFLTDEALLNRALAHPDARLRKWAMQWLERVDNALQEDLIIQLTQDPFAPIRRDAYLLLFQQDPAAGETAARDLIFERSICLRQLGIYILNQAGLDIPRFYLQRLEALSIETQPKPAQIKCCLWGLGELNCQAEVPQITLYLAHPTASVRRQAVKTLGQLIGREQPYPAHRFYLLPALEDSDISVIREAARQLAKYRIALPKAQVQSYLDATADSSRRLIYLGLVRQLNPFYTRLLVYLSSLAEAPAGSDWENQIKQEIQRWACHPQGYLSQPTPDERLAIEAYLAPLKARLNDGYYFGKSVFEQLNFILKSAL